MYQTAISAPKLDDFLFIFPYHWHYHSAMSSFLEPNHHNKASDYPIIFELLCHFYLQSPPAHKYSDQRDVE